MPVCTFCLLTQTFFTSILCLSQDSGAQSAANIIFPTIPLSFMDPSYPLGVACTIHLQAFYICLRIMRPNLHPVAPDIHPISPSPCSPFLSRIPSTSDIQENIKDNSMSSKPWAYTVQDISIMRSLILRPLHRAISQIPIQPSTQHVFLRPCTQITHQHISIATFIKSTASSSARRRKTQME